MFCLEVVIYKRLQMWRHNDVIGRNKYLISTLLESTVPYVYSLQFLFKSTHHSWRYERKCEWVFFFWTQCRQRPTLQLPTNLQPLSDLSYPKRAIKCQPRPNAWFWLANRSATEVILTGPVWRTSKRSYLNRSEWTELDLFWTLVVSCIDWENVLLKAGKKSLKCSK